LFFSHSHEEDDMAGRPKAPNKDKLFRDALPMQLAAAHSEGKAIPGPRNRRSDMWMLSRDWLTDPAGVDVPDLDSLQADACGPAITTTPISGCCWRARSRCVRPVCARPTSGMRWR
jgi:hypothetical protein